MNLWNTQPFVFTILAVVTYLAEFGDGKGGGGGGGRGGGGFGGGGRGIGGSSRGGYSRSLFGGKKGSILLPAAAGAAGYAYGSLGSGHRFHTNPNQNPAVRSGGAGIGDTHADEDYKAQESTYYGRKEGLGMSAFGILALILGIIAAGTLAWYCYLIGVPLWQDRQRRLSRNRTEGHPLALGETPSTATPSP